MTPLSEKDGAKPEGPPKHPPQTYGDFYAWFIAKNYAHQQAAAE